jgi:hypothetical protein
MGNSIWRTLTRTTSILSGSSWPVFNLKDTQFRAIKFFSGLSNGMHEFFEKNSSLPVSEPDKAPVYGTELFSATKYSIST